MTVIVSRDACRFRDAPARSVADPFESAAPDGFSVRLVHLERERRSPHLHPHSQEAIHVLKGKGVLWEDGTARRFVEGDTALIEARVPHATVPDPGTGMDLICFFPHADLPANTEELTDVVVPESEGRSSAS
jgi:quercetin dioxygenase-like cupin family protein